MEKEEVPNALDLLEKLLALIHEEWIPAHSRDTFKRIAAQCADIRDGTDV